MSSRFSWNKVGTSNSLIDEAAKLMQQAGEALARVRELHKPCTCEPDCYVCVECDQAYPCSTIRAIEGKPHE